MSSERYDEECDPKIRYFEIEKGLKAKTKLQKEKQMGQSLTPEAKAQINLVPKPRVKPEERKSSSIVFFFFFNKKGQLFSYILILVS